MVAIGGGNEGHLESPAREVALGLVQPVRQVPVLALRLEHRYCHRLVARARPHVQGVIRPSDRAPPRPPVRVLDGAERLLAPDQVLGRPPPVEGGVIQMLARLRLVEECPPSRRPERLGQTAPFIVTGTECTYRVAGGDGSRL